MGKWFKYVFAVLASVFYIGLCVVIPFMDITGNEFWEQVVIGHFLFLFGLVLSTPILVMEIMTHEFVRRMEGGE